MELNRHRPKLKSFRATEFHGKNPGPADGKDAWSMQFSQTIEVGLGLTVKPTKRLQALLKIDFDAKATREGDAAAVVEFKANYHAEFDFDEGVTEEQVTPYMAQDEYQYNLVAQVFPLAMTHFRREMQAFGFNARDLPLGL